MKIGHARMKQATKLAGWSICGSSSVYAPYKAAEQVFKTKSEIGLPEPNTCGAQFAYLFRRFGYPIHGWDDYKSLVCYSLTTPHKEVILWCKPSAHIRHSFGFGLSADLERRAMTIEFDLPNCADWDTHPLRAEIDTAISAAMTELLRPVPVRDTLYNILGRVKDDSPYASWAHADFSKQAGYGLGAFDPAKEYAEAS